MSKPTHILVPIDSIEYAIQVIELMALNRPLLEIERQKLQYLKDIRDSEQSIKVDLSEEGIKVKAGEGAEGLGAEDVYHENMYIHGYQQCAKDLLNTK